MPLLIAAPFTPMDEQGNLNLEAIPDYAAYLAYNQVDGAFIAGSTGEGPSLSIAEKKALFKTWAEAVPEGFKTIALVGGTSLPETQALALYAQSCGIQAISVIAPYYFIPSNVEALGKFCAAVAAEVPDMPLYYYHIPALSRCAVNMIDFLEFADTHLPSLQGIKFTHPNLMDFHACIHRPGKSYQMLWGRDEELLAALSMGAHGAVGSTYNYMSPVFRELVSAFLAKDLPRASILQQRANACIEVLIRYGGIAPGKVFMRLAGMDCGPCRVPLDQLSPEKEGEISTALSERDFFAICSRPVQGNS